MQSTPVAPAPTKIQMPDDRLTLPGCGLPLDFTPRAQNHYGVESRSLFPTVLDDRDIESGYIDQPALTLREKKMLELLNEFTDIEGWYEDDKIFDPCFMQNWKKENCKDNDVTQRMIDEIANELRFKARFAKTHGYVNIFNGDVVKSCRYPFDDPDFSKELTSAMRNFEKGLSHNIEYRMVAGPQEVDYVHPSFFPLVFGKTKVLRDRVINRDEAVDFMGKGDVLPVPADPGPSRKDLSWNIASRSDIMPHPYSSRFQWLPSDVYFRPDGTCYFDSYINNLHPQRYKHLYPILEKLLDKVIPMFNMTLTPVKSLLRNPPRIELQDVQYKEISPGKTEPKPCESPHESRLSYEDRLRDWRRKYFVAVHPEPGAFKSIGATPEMMEEMPPEERNKHRLVDLMDLKKEYGDRGLQVIVRINDTVLTPENPEFKVSWHMEGQINEHICASALYYYDLENIGTLQIDFRQISDTRIFPDLTYDRGDTVWLEQIFGMTHDGSTVQDIGSIDLRKGRLITFPNTLQHEGTIRLQDPTKDGHAHAINFMLIDPNIRIISTANVPPQRLDWKHEADLVGSSITQLTLEEKLKLIPREGNYPWALQEATDILTETIEERMKFNHYQDVAFHSRNVEL